jgi:hypothetical protein
VTQNLLSFYPVLQFCLDKRSHEVKDSKSDHDSHHDDDDNNKFRPGPAHHRRG